MTIDAVKTKLLPALAANKLFYFSTTSLRSVYISHTMNMTLDEAEEVLTWKDVTNGLNYTIDVADINLIATSDEPNNFPPLTLY